MEAKKHTIRKNNRALDSRKEKKRPLTIDFPKEKTEELKISRPGDFGLSGGGKVNRPKDSCSGLLRNNKSKKKCKRRGTEKGSQRRHGLIEEKTPNRRLISSKKGTRRRV